MALKHPEYAHGISDAELMKEALEFCDEELAGFIGMEYDSDSEVCCQRSDTFIRELVHRLQLLSAAISPVSAGDAGEPVAYLTRNGDNERVVLAKFVDNAEKMNGSGGWTFTPLYAHPLDRLRRELEEARRRTAELEAALKPFMWGDDALCEILFGDFPDDKSMHFIIPLGDFRRARAALRAGEE